MPVLKPIFLEFSHLAAAAFLPYILPKENLKGTSYSINRGRACDRVNDP
jgi:hypothetical protein